MYEVQTMMSKVVPAGQRHEMTEYLGGIMVERGCHVMDLAFGVLGKPAM